MIRYARWRLRRARRQLRLTHEAWARLGGEPPWTFKYQGRVSKVTYWQNQLYLLQSERNL